MSCAKKQDSVSDAVNHAAGPAKSGYEASLNRVVVNTPSVNVNVKRDNVPYVEYPAPEISIPSINKISPDISVILPNGTSFEDLFESASKDGSAITMTPETSLSEDTAPSENETPSVIKDTPAAAKVPPSANFLVTISPDSLTDMKQSLPERPKTPLRLYYKMSDYTYNGNTLHGACTPMTMINCLNKFNDNGDCTLTETLDLAYRLNLWNPSDGMSAEGIFITTAALNELHSTANSAALFGPKDCDELGDIIDKGLTAGVCVDSSMLWKGVRDGYADHMIAVLETDRDSSGILRGFEIIDSGMGVTYVSADRYDECALGNKLGFVMVFGNPKNPPY